MKRHHSGELPLSAPAGDGVGRLRSVAEEEEPDKQGKYDKAQHRCSHLFFLLLLAATVSLLLSHCYDSGSAGGVVRIEAVPRTPPLLPGGRKIVPIARGELPVPQRSPPASENTRDESILASDGDEPSSKSSSPGSSAAGSRSDTGDRALSKDSASVSGQGNSDQRGDRTVLRRLDIKGDLCNGRYIYVQELPPRFNSAMVQSCGTLSPWTDMCGSTSNGGFGPQLVDGALFQETGWYDTDAHALDLIFHARMERYECLTSDPSLAAAVFVPFYAGLDVARHLWGHDATARDALALDLVDWLARRPEWARLGRPRPLLRRGPHHVGLSAAG
ncbi:hypothetical protein PR202_gb08207 [Eleusine coracana subsp. coracana]|uniref:Exostosin GT47 domain-containing protein n=1 Tax=Eleusine coracana subsp. coracana TaxID=191504 RepID=A0AAV5EBI8_ELECO|nr:hypothetical protein PR202_gb08207 [Eleusine coracana subsp. coracana]